MMLSSQKAFRRSLQAALQSEPARWTPQCPEPELLLDWIEQGDAHPQSAALLEHLSSCVYCRREYVAMRETWVLARSHANAPSTPVSASLTVAALPRKVAAWLEELLNEGLTAPVRAVRAALERLDRAVAQMPLVPVRSTKMPFDLHPAFTAIRSLTPDLSWAPAERADGYQVIVSQSLERRGLRQVWSGDVGPQTQCILPEQAGLEPGRVYVWQVIALQREEEFPSLPVGFTIVTEPVRRTVETLEQEVGETPLALAGLYEAHGLYEEALQQLEQVERTDGGSEPVQTLRRKLQEMLHYPLS